MPEIVYSPGPVVVTTLIVCPTDRLWSRAVPASTTTSSGPEGGAPPASTVSEVVAASHDPPIGGAPPFCTTLFVAGSTIHAVPPIDPSAAATPSTACTLGRTLSGIGLRSLPPPLLPAAPGSKAVVACTTTSVPLNTSPKRLSKLCSAVSVRMNDPAVMPTPSTTASAVIARRSLRPSRLLIVARSMS